MLLLASITHPVVARTPSNPHKKEQRLEERAERKELRDNQREFRRDLRFQRKALEGQIQISGAFALYPMMVQWAGEFQKQYPRVKIDISAGGSGKGITDAITQMADIGMASRDINEVEIENGAVVISVAMDAVIPTINSNNPYILEILTTGIKPSVAKGLWVEGSVDNWGKILNNNISTPVHLYTRSDASGAQETWAHFLGTKPEKLRGTAVYSDPTLASVVQRDKLAIGYNNIAFVYNTRTKKPHSRIMALPLDLNEDGIINIDESFYGTLDELTRAIENGKYPMPPARELFIVCSNKQQSPEVLAFIEYILTHGQSQCYSNGYVPMSYDRCDKELEKLTKLQ